MIYVAVAAGTLIGAAIGVFAGMTIFGKRIISFMEFKRIRDEGHDHGVEAAAKIMEECAFGEEEKAHVNKLATLIRKTKINP